MPHDAISTNNSCKPPIRIQKPGMQRSLERFFCGENRRSNIVYIQQLLMQVVERYETCKKDTHATNMRERIVEETKGAIKGLYNLKQSYEGDAQFEAALDVNIATVKLRLNIQGGDFTDVASDAATRNNNTTQKVIADHDGGGDGGDGGDNDDTEDGCCSK